MINAITNADVKDITVNGGSPTESRGPAGIAYNPINHDLYVAAFGSNQVFVIDTITNSIVDIITVGIGTRPFDIVYNPTNHNMYVTNLGSNTISVIDSTINEVIANIPAGNNPAGITYDSLNQHMYVTNPYSNTVTMIHP